MEFEYSDLLSVVDNSTGGLAGNIPVRRHRSQLEEDIGAVRAQEDWKRYIGPLPDFRGGLSRKYGLVRVTIPECRPERLEVLAYANEIGFLYDDCTELLHQEQVELANDKMQSAFLEGVQHGKIGREDKGLKFIQSKLFDEMIAIDKPRAVVAMKVWSEFLQEAAGREHHTAHKSFDEYMRYRVLDVGEMFWFGLATFGMALTIPESEIPIIRKLTSPCWTVLCLQNNICSYNKELRTASARNDVPHVVNALWVLMKEHEIDLDSARAICLERIQLSIAEYQRTVTTHNLDQHLSKDARIYLESLLYTISGDAAWSLVTPRYNFDQAYSDLQLDMMANGVKETLEKMQQSSSCIPSISEKNRWTTDMTEASLDVIMP